MEAAFYYIVRVKLIRFIKGDDIDYISEEIEFKDENPIIARERAFDYYNSYIDTLLEPNLSHKQIEALLSERIKGADKPYDFFNISDEEEIYNPPSWSNGIGVFLVLNKPFEHKKKGDEHLIYGLGFGIFGTPLSIMDNLTSEVEYYNRFRYDKNDEEISVRFYNYDDDEIYNEVILQTPYDWTGLDARTPEEEGEKEEQRTEGNLPRDLTSEELTKSLIITGEGKMIEFKPSLLSYKKGDEVFFGKYNKFIIIKTIAAFLNSSGGFLLVGLNDKGEPIGLENDFSLAGDKAQNSKDYFKIQVDYIIKENFKSIASNINGEFVQVEGKEIYLFRVKPSPNPVFVSNNTESTTNPTKEFYVRTTGASSIHYYDIEDIVGYCMNHWK